MITAQQIISGLGDLLLQPVAPDRARLSFHKAIVDSRTAVDGDVFVALPGERVDGKDYIGDAIQSGATGILAKRWPDNVPSDLRTRATLFQVDDPLNSLQTIARWWRTQCPTKVVGVTGSVGKTSTKEAIAAVLGSKTNVFRSTGNSNTEISLPLMLLELEPEHEYAVLEMGMFQKGDIAFLCSLAKPSVGVVTNVGPAHLERLGTMERITEAKSELVESLPEEGVAVLNADDHRVASMAGKTSARVITYGIDSTADCRATDVASRGLDGVDFNIAWQGSTLPVHVPLPGRHNVYTALAAASVALTAGFTLGEVSAALRNIGTPGRIKVIETPQGARILDDSYNASPASMKAGLDLLAELPGRKIAVLGDMLELGAAEASGHEEVGKHAAGIVDALYTVGERAQGIGESARREGLSNVQHFTDLEHLAHALQPELRSGVSILIKGSRGMALEKLIDLLSKS